MELERTGSTVIGFNVAQMLKSPIGTSRRVQVDEMDEALVADLRLVSPTRGSLRLMRTAAGILVTGTLVHQVESTCSRCLEMFVRTQVIEVEDEFVPVIDIATGLPLSDSEDLDAFRLTPNHVLDLGEAIRQYAILEDPLQPLCSADCRGLCVDCGANLNLGPCGCQAASSSVSRGTLGALLAERMRQAGLKPEQE